MSNRYTYQDPVLSRWQAAVAEVRRRHAATAAAPAGTVAAEALSAPISPADDPLMAPAHTLGSPLQARQTIPVEISSAVAAPAAGIDLAASAQSVVSVPIDCAKVAAQFLWAEITGNQQKSNQYAGEIKDSECDPLWAECLTTYLGYKFAGTSLPYNPSQNPVIDLGQRTKLAIVGDWGTGDGVATNVLREISKLGPDVLIHLGDVYYAGTNEEEQTNFLNVCRQVLGNNVLLFSLCGNHDMYSGGQGYYWLVGQLGQQASYFCLQNPNWQFLAMDTGHNDNNPITVATNMTSLVQTADWAEEDWLLDKINLAGGKKTVLLSHHQLFSPFGSVGSVNGQAYCYNPNLRATFQAVMPQIMLWFWGHEHTFAMFDPYMNLQRGRCLGASAVPVFTNQQSYSNASDLATYGGLPLPTWNTNCQLGNNGESYNNCFAFMTLNGTSATVDYYQVPIDGTATNFLTTDSV
jgi:hypothetical protein